MPERARFPALRRRHLGLGVLAGLSIIGVLTHAGIVPGLRAQEQDAQARVRALLRVSRTKPYVLYEPSDGAGPAREAYSVFRAAQLELVRSNSVLLAALRNPEVAKLPSLERQADRVAWLRQNLRVEFVNDSDVLEVSMSNVSHIDAATLVNAVADAYVTAMVNHEHNARLYRLSQLKELYTRYQDSLTHKRQTLQELRESAFDEDPDEKRLREEQVSSCRRELLRVKLERVASEVKLERQKAAKKTAEGDVKRVGELEESVAVLAAQEKALRDEDARLLAKVDRKKPHRVAIDLEPVRDEIALAEAAAKKIGAEVEKLNIELQAPPRVRLLEKAEPH
jgi:hypothetical protein